mgnify:FL=1
MVNIYTNISRNVTKTWILMSLFFIVVIFLGYFFSIYYGNPNILYFFVIFSILMNITSYYFSDRIALSLAGAKPASREEHFVLYTTLENLSITAGLPMPRVYVINDPALNAFATGRDKNHAVVAVTSGLLAVLDKTELEGVLAHELSHIGNRDMLLSTVVVVLVGFISIISDMFLRHLFWERSRDNGKGNAVFLIVGIILSILAPIFALLIQLAISRKREFLADASGTLLTRYPEGLANALRKIEQSGQPMARQSSAIAHLYIADPKGEKRSKIGQKINSLFDTHPKIEQRIEALIGK